MSVNNNSRMLVGGGEMLGVGGQQAHLSAPAPAPARRVAGGSRVAVNESMDEGGSPVMMPSLNRTLQQ